MPWEQPKNPRGRRPRPTSCSVALGDRNDHCSPPDREGEGWPHRYLTPVTPPSLVYKRGGSPPPQARGNMNEHTPALMLITFDIGTRLNHTLVHPGTWELLSLSRSSLYPLLQAPRSKIIQCLPRCWTYGPVGRNQDKSGVTVFLLAASLLVGARPRGPDTDTLTMDM